MSKSLLIILRYEVLTTLRQAYSWLTPVLFFVIVVCLFPLAIGPDNNLLTQIAPGIIWVAALLAVLISIGNLFKQDAQDGSLDLTLLSHHSLTLLVFCKTLAHWLTHCLPLILISPLLGLLLHLNAQQEMSLLITLLLGTPVLTLLGAIGSALVVGIRNNGLLLPILIMPLYIPVLIFGTGCLIAATQNQPLSAYYAIMGALLLLSLGFAPFLTGVALRIGVDQ
jgi:heme exporter protein B